MTKKTDNRGYTYSEEWRQICEAREILSWPLAKRRAHLDKLELMRSPKAVAELKKIMIQEFEKMKNER